jgi:DNA-directed RNA polymerase specialized sigma24 family protein
MTWVKLILDSRFKDLLRKYRVPDDESISIDDPDTMVEAEIAKIYEPEPESIGSKLRDFIKTDPEDHLGKHIRDNPTATFQAILLMRLDGLKWQDIANRLNIASHSTVNNFHDKQLGIWKDYFRKYLSKYRREQSPLILVNSKIMPTNYGE